MDAKVPEGFDPPPNGWLPGSCYSCSYCGWHSCGYVSVCGSCLTSSSMVPVGEIIQESKLSYTPTWTATTNPSNPTIKQVQWQAAKAAGKKNAQAKIAEAMKSQPPKSTDESQKFNFGDQMAKLLDQLKNDQYSSAGYHNPSYHTPPNSSEVIIIAKKANGALEMIHFDNATVDLVQQADPYEKYARVKSSPLSKIELVKDGVINRLLGWLG